jgi:hypothetical protein
MILEKVQILFSVEELDFFRKLPFGYKKECVAKRNGSYRNRMGMSGRNVMRSIKDNPSESTGISKN